MHEADIKDVAGIDTMFAGEPPSKRRRQLRINPNRARWFLGRLTRFHRLCRYVRVVKAPRRVQKARRDIVGLQVREIGENLLV